MAAQKKIKIERTQLGIRIETKMAKALKMLSKEYEMPVGHLLEDTVNHAFSGHSSFPTEKRPHRKNNAEEGRQFRKLLKSFGYEYNAHTPQYFVEKKSKKPSQKELQISRANIGMRMEKRMVKVLKGLAELLDTNLGVLMEEIVAHALDGHSTFSGPSVKTVEGKQFRKKLDALMHVYGLDYAVHDHENFKE